MSTCICRRTSVMPRLFQVVLALSLALPAYLSGNSSVLSVNAAEERKPISTLVVEATEPSPTLRADYQFQDTLTSSVGTAPELTNLGGNTFVTETVDGGTRTVLHFLAGDGLASLPKSGIIPADTYSIVVLFRFETITSWRRIVDFKNATSDRGLYNYNGKLEFYPVARGTAALIAVNTYIQVVLTRDVAKNIVGYVNGEPQISFVDSLDNGVINTNNILRFFRDDDVIRNEHSAGSVARIRLYDGPLTADQVAALDRLPGEGSLKVTSVSPNSGGNAGTATLVVLGSGFETGAGVRLLEGSQPVLAGENTLVVSSTRIQTSFDLRGQSPKALTLEVVNPDGTSAAAPEAFTIERGGEPGLWVDIVGRDQIRVGREQTFWIRYGNAGNVDAWGDIFVYFPRSVSARLTVETDTIPLTPADLPPDYDSDWMGFMIGVREISVASTATIQLALSVPSGIGNLEIRTLITGFPKSSLQAMSGSYEGALIANLKRNLSFSQGSEETRRVQGDLWVSPTTEHAVIVFPDDGLAWTEVGGIGKMGTIQEIEALVQSRGLAKLEGKSLDLPADHVQEFKRLLTLDTEEINRWKHDTQAEIDFKNPGENRFDCIGRPEYRAEQAGIVIDGCKGFLCDETYKSKTYYEGDMFAYRFGIPDDRRPKRTVFPMDAAFLRKLLGQPVQNGFPVTVVASMDPNDKSGPAGFAAERYIAPEQELLYAVFFENLASATAPAQEVVISDQLDPEKMDLSTVSLGAITFGDRQVLPPPNASDWTTDVDLRPDQDLLVRIHASLNSTSGLITWQLSSIDPATGLPPEDPLVGFLPPNVNPPEGEGSVIFTLMPKQSLPTGTQMRNKATIVFDVNPPIDTPEWFNTLDNTRPASQVLPLASSQLSPTFELEWSGTDTHSGLKDYTIYVSDNNDTYTPWLASVTSTTEIFTGLPGHTYRFYSVARDNTGNIENTPDQPDATTWIMGSVYLPIILR